MLLPYRTSFLPKYMLTTACGGKAYSQSNESQRSTIRAKPDTNGDLGFCFPRSVAQRITYGVQRQTLGSVLRCPSSADSNRRGYNPKPLGEQKSGGPKASS